MYLKCYTGDSYWFLVLSLIIKNSTFQFWAHSLKQKSHGDCTCRIGPMDISTWTKGEEENNHLSWFRGGIWTVYKFIKLFPFFSNPSHFCSISVELLTNKFILLFLMKGALTEWKDRRFSGLDQTNGLTSPILPLDVTKMYTSEGKEKFHKYTCD